MDQPTSDLEPIYLTIGERSLILAAVYRMGEHWKPLAANRPEGGDACEIPSAELKSVARLRLRQHDRLCRKMLGRHVGPETTGKDLRHEFRNLWKRTTHIGDCPFDDPEPGEIPEGIQT